MANFYPEPGIPPNPSIYHILHVDRLMSVFADGFLFSDAQMEGRTNCGTMIGYAHTKGYRRERVLEQGVGLKVGECVPFYYCPRSVMLYVIYKANHTDLAYHGGERPIVHLRLDPVAVANWAEQNRLRYYVTDVTAATAYFTAYPDLDAMNLLDWQSIRSNQWEDVTDRKQAEFLVEKQVPVSLIAEIGVINPEYKTMVEQILKLNDLDGRIAVNVHQDWYY